MLSSVIRHYRYDSARRVLDVTFVSGRRYAYQDVPAKIAAAMDVSFSKGEFFNSHIRPYYHFTRLSVAAA